MFDESKVVAFLQGLLGRGWEIYSIAFVWLGLAYCLLLVLANMVILCTNCLCTDVSSTSIFRLSHCIRDVSLEPCEQFVIRKCMNCNLYTCQKIHRNELINSLQTDFFFLNKTQVLNGAQHSQLE